MSGMSVLKTDPRNASRPLPECVILGPHMLKGFRGAWLRGTSDPLRAALGHLERIVMDTVWRGGDFSVRHVQGQLPRTVAYTTVMTTLDRLFKKGLVLRRREGRAFVYRAALERHELEAAMTTGLLNELLSNSSSAARPFLSNLVDVVADSDRELLDELERLVRDKRERINREPRIIKEPLKVVPTRKGQP
jgi:predicted transcriptional regulator